MPLFAFCAIEGAAKAIVARNTMDIKKLFRKITSNSCNQSTQPYGVDFPQATLGGRHPALFSINRR